MANEFIIKNGYRSQGNSEITGSLNVTAGITGSLQGTATSASFAATASYLSNYIPPFPYTGSAEITGSLGITGSLTTSGSAVNLQTDNFTVNPIGIDSLIVDPNGVQIYDSTDGTMVLDSNTRRLFDTSDIVSINFDNRQLVKSDGATVTLDWETGAMTGSFTGSFVGDGSGLTGVGATEYIRRSDYTSSLDPNVNYLYTGYAPVGSAESATVWTLSRLAISASGATITQVTSSAAWTNRYSYTYL
jgi:hypothetical protein